MPTEHLYLFAPENDMALAFGGAHYTPTPVARAIARDLSLLPLWYACNNAAVWAQQTIPDEMQAILHSLGITARATTSPCNEITTDTICHPWGWSRYIVERLVREGAARQSLPDITQIDRLRQLSGRATSREILSLWADRCDYPLPPLPEVLHNDKEVETFVTSYPATLLKTPWSSSGRGILPANGIYTSTIARNTSGTIRKQGYIMGEVLLEKVQDLAMEFYSDGKHVTFAGYSHFITDGRGAYQGNTLADDQTIESLLSRYIDTVSLHLARQLLTEITTELIAPHYTGYFGIDMLIYHTTNGEYRLHPCIELNLRMSMGMVAHTIAKRLLAPSSTGYYKVEYLATTQQHKELEAELRERYPLHIIDGRITKGYLPLTPLLPDTHYRAYIVVDNIL